MNIIEDIFLYSQNKGLLNQKYRHQNIDIKKLSEQLCSDEVTEDIDNIIDTIISMILKLKRELKTPEKVQEYIKAVLIETEQKENIRIGFK